LKNKALIDFFLVKVVDKGIEKCENDFRKYRTELSAKLLF